MSVASGLIKQARLSAGLTQAELARRAGTSQPAVAVYESGRKIPTVETLGRLLRAAGAELRASRPSRRQHSVGLRRLLRERRQQLLDIAATYHGSNVRVFGSVARGEEHPGSDIDLLVDFEPGRSLCDQVRLRRALTEALGVQVDLVSSRGLLDRDSGILEEAIPL